MALEANLSTFEPETFLQTPRQALRPASQQLPAVVPILEAESIAAAVLHPDGRVVCASSAFHQLRAERYIDLEHLTRAAQGAPPAYALVELDPAGGSDLSILAYGQARQALAWRLPSEVQGAAIDAPHLVVVLASHAAIASGPLENACRAYDLSGLQSRVALETVRTGNVRAAAEALNLSYHTVREAMAEVMRRMRAPRLAAVVQKLTTLAFGILPDDDGDSLLTDIWGLSPRQAGIAGLIAGGFTRAEAARATGLSQAVVKKELDQVYQLLQVGSSAALARKIVETNALSWLMRSTRGDIGFVDAVAEPLKFVHRPDGSRIAVSDYGPASGRPVLVAHSSLSTRPVSRDLVRTLQRAGYRPIAIDRPGFGMSDEHGSLRPGRDPYPAAASDALLVLDGLKLPVADLVARGAAKFVLALHAAAPSRLGRVVMVNPGLNAKEDHHRGGLFGLLKEAYARNPRMIGLWVSYLSRQITVDRHQALVRRWVRGSAPDEAAIENPTIARDYFHAQRMFATGRVNGYVNEQMDYLRHFTPAPIRGTTEWRVLVAAHDTLHDPIDVLAYWRRIVPDASFRIVDDAGRLLAMSHPQYVVEALSERTA